nr:MAG TPA: ATP-dependent Clp protease ATP-binding subunit [Caudoviricetes sp.]
MYKNNTYDFTYIYLLIQKKCSFCRQPPLTPVLMRVFTVTLFLKKCRQSVTTLAKPRCTRHSAVTLLFLLSLSV